MLLDATQSTNAPYSMFNIHFIYSLILEFGAFGFVYIILDVLRVFGSLSGLCLVSLRVLKWCTDQSKLTPWCQRRPPLLQRCGLVMSPLIIGDGRHYANAWP
jgi:hypothetical protein